MTDNDIIKALECCVNGEDCPNCPLQEQFADCKPMTGALDLINRQKAEIERLRAECGNQSTLWSQHYESIFEMAKETIKTEAVKEFAERFERYLLSQLTSAPLDKKEWINFCLDELDNLKKEMVGAENG